MSARVALLGATGRLGPAVCRALARSRSEVRALARREPHAEESAPGVRSILGDRGDVEALVPIIDGAESVVDLLLRHERDSDALLAAIARAARPPKTLVLVGCSSERRRDPAAEARLAARVLVTRGFSGVVHTLVLPRLVAAVDFGRREELYLDQSSSTGRALFAGDPSIEQSVLAVDDAAEVIRRLVAAPGALPPGAFEVAPPSPIPVRDAIASLLRGAGLEDAIGNHPDPSYRAPHPVARDVLDGAIVRAAFPDLAWTDPRTVYRELGAWLAKTKSAAARPRRAVPVVHHRAAPRATIDVHGAREEVVVARPVEALTRLTAWMSPAFYVDVGRPCNSACVYCAVPPHGDTHGFTPLDEVRAHVRAGVAAGCSHAIFVGGEPTIYPHLDEALTSLREAGLSPKHAMMTNGLRLSDASFLEHLRASGIATVHLSIDTVDEAVYDQISRAPGTFARQRAALDNALRSPGLQLYVYAAVTRPNAPGLGDLLRDLAERAGAAAVPPPPVILAFVKPVGDAKVHADLLRLTPQDRAIIARKAVARGAELGVAVGLRNLQACLAPELVPHMVDYYLDDYSVDLATLRREPYAHSVEHVSRLPSCDGCAHAPLCPGVYRDEAARGPIEDFRAIPRDEALIT